MNTSDTLDINVALLPDARIGDTAISLSRKIADKYSVHFTLDTNNHIPHISLYHARYPKENYEKVLQSVEKITDSIVPFPIVLDRFSNEMDFIFYCARPSGGFSLLQKMVLDNLNGLRQGMKPEYQSVAGNQSVDSKTQEYLEQYGYSNVLDRFVPHLTITRLTEIKNVHNALLLLPNISLEFKPAHVVIGTIGPHGTLPKIEKAFTL